MVKHWLLTCCIWEEMGGNLHNMRVSVGLQLGVLLLLKICLVDLWNLFVT